MMVKQAFEAWFVAVFALVESMRAEYDNDIYRIIIERSVQANCTYTDDTVTPTVMGSCYRAVVQACDRYETIDWKSAEGANALQEETKKGLTPEPLTQKLDLSKVLAA
jgi:hypothetical protein